MGVLKDIGVIDENGKVTDEAFAKYVKDVLEMLKSGNGVFPPGIECSKKIEPVPTSPLLKSMKNKDGGDFKQFHQIWRPRYEGMVKCLDVPGDFQLAKNFPPIGFALMDPSAVAVALGAKPPKLDLQGAILAILAAQLPGGPAFDPTNIPKFTSFCATYLKDLNVVNPQILEEAITKALNIVAPSLPIPPIPSLPDPRLLDFGYTEQFNFALGLAMAPLKTHLRMMVPAFSLKGFVDSILPKLAQGDALGGLVKFVCEEAAKDQPASMSTSSLEIAAQQVLQQHQVKFQALAFVGQNIGSGVVVSGLARAPMSSGGLEVFGQPEEVEQESQLSPGTKPTALRKLIKDIVCFRTRVSRKKGNGPVTNSPEDWEGFGEPPEDKANFLGQLKLVSQSDPLFIEIVPDIATTQSKPVAGSGGNYTSCHEVPPWLFGEVIKRKQFNNDLAAYVREYGPTGTGKKMRPKILEKYKLDGLPENGCNTSGVQKAGVTAIDNYVCYAYSSPWVPGRRIEIDRGKKFGSVWRITDPNCKLYDQEAVMYDSPNLGDVLVTGDITNDWKSMPDGGRERVGQARTLGRWMAHVCIFWKRIITEDGKEIWITFDGGQGSSKSDAAGFSASAIIRDPQNGILKSGKTFDASTNNGGKYPKVGVPSIRIVCGWLDIDQVPELSRGTENLQFPDGLNL